MEKSIETIWKEGFLQGDALVAPKVNDLYNQKSQHLIDKFKRMFRKNINYVIILALVHLAIGYFGGVPLIGVVLFLIFIPLIIASKKEMHKVNNLDKSLSSYQYLKTFDTWLKASIAHFSKIYRFFYPIYFPSLALGLAFSSFFEPYIGETLASKIMNDPDTYMISGFPVYWVLALVVLVCLAALFSGALYKFDLNMVYGRVFKKLEEILADIEELRN